MRMKVLGLVTLLSMSALLLLTLLFLNNIITMNGQQDQQTFLTHSNAKGMSADPTGCPGSGKGQGPYLVALVRVSEPNTLKTD